MLQCRCWRVCSTSGGVCSKAPGSLHSLACDGHAHCCKGLVHGYLVWEDL